MYKESDMLKLLVLFLLLVPNITKAKDINYWIDSRVIAVSKGYYSNVYIIKQNKELAKNLKYNDCINNIDLTLYAPKLIESINKKEITIYDIEKYMNNLIKNEVEFCEKNAIIE